MKPTSVSVRMAFLRMSVKREAWAANRGVVDELPDLTKMKQLGANTVIDLGDGFSITLVNVLVTDITADDFEVRM